MGGDGEASRLGVAAKALQQVAALFQGGEQREPAAAAAGAFPTVALQADHKRGHPIPLRQTRGHDAHHALMPVLTGQDDGAAPQGGALIQQGGALAEDVLLHQLPLSVQLAQLLRQLRRQQRIIGEQ